MATFSWRCWLLLSIRGELQHVCHWSNWVSILMGTQIGARVHRQDRVTVLTDVDYVHLSCSLLGNIYFSYLHISNSTSGCPSKCCSTALQQLAQLQYNSVLMGWCLLWSVINTLASCPFKRSQLGWHCMISQEWQCCRIVGFFRWISFVSPFSSKWGRTWGTSDGLQW